MTTFYNKFGFLLQQAIYLILNQIYFVKNDHRFRI